MTFDTFFQNTLTDTEVKVMELLHENIRRQAFFDKPWPRSKNPTKAGKKLLYQSGDLQDGYMSHTEGMNIHITNSVDYAGVHNEGAEIPVTAQMKKYFWAMYYKASGARSKTKKCTSGSLSMCSFFNFRLLKIEPFVLLIRTSPFPVKLAPSMCFYTN